MTTATLSTELIEGIAARLDLRGPNKEALESLVIEMERYFEIEGGSPPYEAVIDAATGVGKTYILAAAIEYFAALGTRNFAVVTPGRTILEKTEANFTKGHPKSLLEGMEVEPVVITSENFATPQLRAAMDDPEQVKLYIFTVHALTKPKTEVGRKTHKFQEGLGKAFYGHLDNQDDLIVFADEHHCYYGDAFSDAVRGLTPYALVGLTATPHKKTPEEMIVFRYPLAAAIADRLVKTPVLVGRKDDLSDPRTKLADGLRLLEAKEKAVEIYSADTGRESVNPVMLVIAQKIEDAEEYAEILRDPTFTGGKYAESILVIHSNAADKALAELEKVEEPVSQVRVIISVGMLKEGWDVKNVYVICSLRASISDVLTEQTLGRGLRLPWGEYTDWELLDSLEVVAHERYEDLLKKAKAINEEFIDYRTRAIVRRNAQGDEIRTIEKEPVSIEVAPEESGDPSAVAPDGGGKPVLGSVEERQKQAEKEVANAGRGLKPLASGPKLELPVLRPSEIESKFSLNDITDYEPFRKLGRSLAADPASELRRIRLSAHIVQGADGLRRTELMPAKTIDKIEAQPALIPLEEAKKKLSDQLLTSPVVPSRKGERKAVGKLVEVFVDGLGKEAETVLGGYLDRAAAGLIQLVEKEHRRFAPKPDFEEDVEVVPFAPVRKGRPETSTDRIGAFKKGVGYTGWAKSMYEEVWFDSSTERTLANLLEDADEITFWVRLLTGDLEINWEGGTYNPDFVAVDTDSVHWVIEVKADKDMPTTSVQGKREAAQRWSNHVSSNDNVKTEWRYLLASESDIASAKGSWPALVSRCST